MKNSTQHIGKCALCDQEEITLKESHLIPKFVYDWIKDTSTTQYLRSTDNVNRRRQDGPKEYLLCEKCECDLSKVEAEFSSNFFKKLANYRTQATKINVTETMRVCVLSIFWRTILTSINKENTWVDEDKQSINAFLNQAKKQIKENTVTTPIFIVPLYGEPPFFNLPQTYQLERSVGAQDIRFFDDPHRYYVIFKLPFMFFYILSEGWEDDIIENNRFANEIKFDEINDIPEFILSYVERIDDHFEKAKNSMSQKNISKITQDVSKNKERKGAHESMSRAIASNHNKRTT